MKLTLLLLLNSTKDIYLATSILLPSIVLYFNKDNIFEIVILVKNINYENLNKRINEFQNKIDNNLKIRILKETNILEHNRYKNTYYLQMYLKLLASKIIKTDYYLTLDADVVFINDTNINHFLTFSDNDIKCHFYKIKNLDVWMKRSIKYLKYDKIPDYCINQTPFVFKKKLVDKMINEIDVKEAIIKNNCSEYTLYHIYLLKNNLFDINYKFYRFSNFPISFPINKLPDEKINKYLLILKHQGHPISIIQTRINVHHILTNTIKKVVPNSFYNKPKIAVLTSITNNKYLDRYKTAIEIKKNYCKYHNYKFILHKVDENDTKYRLKKGWLKIYKLLDIIEKYDYVFCSDADVIITNRDIRIEDIIFKYMKEEHNLLITTDFNSLNSGNIIWKNNKKSIILLNEMLKVADNKIRLKLKVPFIPKGIYEQPTLIYLINKYEDTYQSMKIIPQFEMNSYCKLSISNFKPNIIIKIDGIVNRSTWKDNDFLVHLAGLNYFKINEKFKYNIDGLIKKFVNRYYQKIYEKEGIDYGKIK